MIKFSKKIFTTKTPIYEVIYDEEAHFEAENRDLSKTFPEHKFWHLHPINAPTLAVEHTLNNLLDGLFLIRSKYIKPDNSYEICFTRIVMPECVNDGAIFLIDSKIVEKRGIELIGGNLLLLTPIEKQGNLR